MRPIQHLCHMEVPRFKAIDELVVPAHFRSLKSIEHVFVVFERVNAVDQIECINFVTGHADRNQQSAALSDEALTREGNHHLF